MKKFFLSLAALCLLAAPTMAQTASAPAPVQGKVTPAQFLANPIVVLQKLSISDLQAALADAQANNDEVTIPCWTALLAGAQAAQTAAPALPVGVFSAIQKGRDVKVQAANLLSPNGPLSKLNIACAPLMMDINGTLGAIGITTGIVVGSGGLTLPALPGFLPLLLAASPK